MTTTPKHRLRWNQYRLRSLFVLTLLVAVAGSWFAVKRQQVERERAAVKWIAELGGWVLHDDQGFIPDKEPPGPVWLRRWLGDDFFRHVTYVDLGGETVTDAQVERLKELRKLEILHLNGTLVTDAGLEHLEGLTQLQRLDLGHTNVTDEGVKRLQEALPNCKIVR